VAAAAPQAAPPKGNKGRGSKGKAAQQQPAGGSTALEAAAAAAQAMLGDPNKLKLAGLLAVMGKLASAEPLVRECAAFCLVSRIIVLAYYSAAPSCCCVVVCDTPSR
jgi:hypothetical protein